MKTMEISQATNEHFNNINANNPSIVIHIAQGDAGQRETVPRDLITSRFGRLPGLVSWTFVEPTYNTSMMHQLNFLRCQGMLTDVKVIVEEREFLCHKVVLASASEFFLTMFQSRPEADEVAITQIAASTVDALLQFLYTGKIDLTLDNLQPLQTAAAFFRVPSLCKGCNDFVNMCSGSILDKVKALQSAGGQSLPDREDRPTDPVKTETGDGAIHSNGHIETGQDEADDDAVARGNMEEEESGDETADTGAYGCHTCAMTFRSKRALNKHAIFHSQSKVCVCKFCGLIFSSVKELGDHARASHSSEKRYICRECGKSYVYPKSLKDHMKVHTGTDLYVCAECGKSFIRPDYLREHSVCHTGVKPHRCGTCGKAYSYRRDLSRHQLTHLEECPFRCDHCGKGFSSRDCFRQHRYTHTGQRPYVCDRCCKGFFYRGDLHRHRRQVHAVMPPAALPPEAPIIKIAPKISRLQELKQLQKKPKKYECDECGESFNRNDSLLGHKHKHTGKKRFACDLCDKEYVYKRDMVRHKSAHHPDAKLSPEDPSI